MKIMIEVSNKDIPDNVTNGDIIKSILKDCGEVVYEKKRNNDVYSWSRWVMEVVERTI